MAGESIRKKTKEFVSVNNVQLQVKQNMVHFVRDMTKKEFLECTYL